MVYVNTPSVKAWPESGTVDVSYFGNTDRYNKRTGNLQQINRNDRSDSLETGACGEIL